MIRYALCNCMSLITAFRNVSIQSFVNVRGIIMSYRLLDKRADIVTEHVSVYLSNYEFIFDVFKTKKRGLAFKYFHPTVPSLQVDNTSLSRHDNTMTYYRVDVITSVT